MLARGIDVGHSRDGLSRRWEAIAAELLKCVMPCANSHREIHAGVQVLERRSTVTSLTPEIGEETAA